MFTEITLIYYLRLSLLIKVKLNLTRKTNSMFIKCFGCGALVENIDGKPHKYIGATQGCWNLYGQVLAKEYCEYKYPETIHRLTVDTYSVQHPVHPCKQSIQSVNIHLISLYLILKKNFNGQMATKIIGNILNNKPIFEWLEPPIPNGIKTIIDVLNAKNIEEHEIKVIEWSNDVLNFWHKKHEQKIENNLKYYRILS
jgi:hypothetical protein